MSRVNRRDAVKGAAGGLLLVAPRTAFGYQANSAVSFGMIGTGGRGRYDATIFTKDPRARLAAICDPFPDRIDLAKTQVPGADRVPSFAKHEDLLTASGLDAVLIASPVFLHPEHFEHAVDARKHIYCEKPAGASVAGVKRLLRASARLDKSKHVQFGFQQRFSPEYLTAEKIIRSGQLGEMLLMKSAWMVGGAPLKPFKPPYPPEVEKLRSWYAWRANSGDFIVEQDCHGVDVLNWYAQAHPLKARGAGGRRKRTYGDNIDWLNVTYEYPGGVAGYLIATQLAQGFGEVSEQFFGSEGTIEVTRQQYRWSRRGTDPVLVRSRREITIDAIEHFLECIVGNKPENMAQAAADSTLTSLLGRMAIDAGGREVAWEEMMRSE